MKRWIFENFWLKVLAFCIALALWAYVGSQQVLREGVDKVPLEYKDIPAGMALDSSVQTSISLELTGRKQTFSDWNNRNELKAVVSLKGYEPGKKEMIVHPKVQPLPNGVTASLSDLTVPLVPLKTPKKRTRKNS